MNSSQKNAFKIENIKFYVGGITKWWTPPVQLLLTTPITLIKMRHEPVVVIESQKQTKQMLCVDVKCCMHMTNVE